MGPAHQSYYLKNRYNNDKKKNFLQSSKNVELERLSFTSVWTVITV